jgi:hypothetical protein
MRMPFTFFVGAATAAVVLAFGEPVPAQNRPSASPTPPAQGALPAPVVADDADRLLKQMSSYIGSAEQFTFHADVTFDHVLPTGQKLQFSELAKIPCNEVNLHQDMTAGEIVYAALMLTSSRRSIVPAVAN